MPTSPTGFVAGNAAPRSVGGEWLGSRDPRTQKFLEALLSGRMLESPEGGDLRTAIQNIPITATATARAPADIANLLYQHTAFNPKNAAQQLTESIAEGNPLADIAGFAMNQMADPTGSGLAKTIGQSPMVTGALDRLRGIGLDEIITGLGEFGTENPDVMHAPLAMGAGFLGKKAAREAAEQAKKLRATEEARLTQADLLNPRKDPFRTRTPEESEMILEQANYPGGSSLKDQPTEVQRAAQQSLARQGFSPGAQVQWKDANVPEGEVGRVSITPEGNIIAPMSEDASGLREGWKMGVPTDIEQSKKLGFDFPGKPTGQVDEIGQDIISRDIRASEGRFEVLAFHGSKGDISHYDPGLRGQVTGASSAREGFYFAKQAQTAEGYTKNGPPRPDFLRAMNKAKAEFDKEIERLIVANDKLIDQATDIHRSGGQYLAGILSYDEYTVKIQRAIELDVQRKIDSSAIQKIKALKQKSVDLFHKMDNLKLKQAADAELQGQNITPVKLRMENPMVYDFAGDPYRTYNYTYALEEAKKMGFDSAIFRNTRDGAGIDDIYVIFDPENIRSTAAAFKELPPSRTKPYALGSLKKQERKKFTAAAYKERADKIAIELEEKYNQLDQQAGDISTGAGAKDWEARRGIGSGRKLVAEYEDLELVADGLYNAYVRELDNTQLATRIARLRTIPDRGYQVAGRARPLTSAETRELEVLIQHRDRRGHRRPATSTRQSNISSITRQKWRNEALDEEAELGRKVRERNIRDFPDWTPEDIKNIELYDDYVDKLKEADELSNQTLDMGPGGAYSGQSAKQRQARDEALDRIDAAADAAVDARDAAKQKFLDGTAAQRDNAGGTLGFDELLELYGEWSYKYYRSGDYELKEMLKSRQDELTDPTKNLRDLLGYDISDIEVYPLSLDPQQLYNAQAA